MKLNFKKSNKRETEKDFEDFDEFDDTYSGKVKPEDDDFYEDDLFNDSKDKFDDMDDDFSGAPIHKQQDLLKDLTNFSPFIKEKVNGWLGIVWDNTQGKYVRNRMAEPIMNEKCAMWCIDCLKVYARGNNVITDIRKDDYNSMMGDVVDYIWLNIGTRSEEFGIKNNGDILRVCNEMEHAIALVLMGAGDGKYNKLFGQVYKSTEMDNRNPTGKNGLSPGFLKRTWENLTQPVQ